MSERFIAPLARDLELNDLEVRTLRSAGIRSFEDLHSLVTCFPSSVAKVGSHLALMQKVAAQGVSQAFASSASSRTASSSPLMPGGASHPPSAHWDVGDRVPISASAGPSQSSGL